MNNQDKIIALETRIPIWRAMAEGESFSKRLALNAKILDAQIEIEQLKTNNT